MKTEANQDIKNVPKRVKKSLEAEYGKEKAAAMISVLGIDFFRETMIKNGVDSMDFTVVDGRQVHSVEVRFRSIDDHMTLRVEDEKRFVSQLEDRVRLAGLCPVLSVVDAEEVS
jgi:hypothetical protein